VYDRRSRSTAERQALWMDLASGSGLWYWRGSTTLVQDILNCHECHQHDHDRIFRHANASDTVIFTHRIADAGQHRPSRRHLCSPGHAFVPFYKVEIVGQHPSPCPPTDTEAADRSISSPGPPSGANGFRSEVQSACPNLRSLPNALIRGAINQHHPVQGTECLWHAWHRNRLRWGWPNGDGTCPLCVHKQVEQTAFGSRAHVQCQWDSH
jgi:hypothetical protein